MIPRVTLGIDPDTLFSLMSQLRTMNSPLSLEEAANQAIQDWLAKAADPPAPSADSTSELAPLRGYQWKTLFLPEGTKLRIAAYPDYPEARVIGNALECMGHETSPNAYIQACPGAHRNAWELISVLLPGVRHWKRADLLRRALPPPVPPKAPPASTVHRWGERRAWNVGGRRETDSMPEQVFLDH